MKLELVIVDASIAVENVAVGATPVETPVAPAAGVVDVTVGPELVLGTTSIAATSGSSAEP